MDVVGRDQARRGQPADKPVTRSVRYRDREHDQHRDKDREMLARGSELDTTSVGRTSTLASSQNSTSWSVIRSFISSSRIILTSCNECRDECCDENRFGRGFEFKVYLRGSSQGSVRVWFQVCIQVCPHAEREGGVRVLGLGFVKCKCQPCCVPHTTSSCKGALS